MKTILRIQKIALLFIAIACTHIYANDLNDPVLHVNLKGEIKVNGNVLEVAKDIEAYQQKVGNKAVNLDANGTCLSTAIMKAMQLFSEAGVEKINLVGNGKFYEYAFPVADGNVKAPWYALSSLPRHNATSPQKDTFSFKEYPDAVLVVIDVYHDSLKCGAYNGSKQIGFLLDELKRKYSLVAIDYNLSDEATYNDMLLALDGARRAGLESYYFTERENK